ncbi:MAG: Branched-chain amino acid aminotransferase [Cytophagales bacterium]|jgi:branched-chain amino acid aminotransferase|nr:branched-chain-amino-acid transaminase [Bacteroidota bacterium]MBS1982244.1 branched-chain-amino-acid transaminase [Bacteroidota bacterium]WHZ09019.1 MAG: Branched-chain amino acid aminotransferase [Cytophagales bacterium]
MKYYTEDSIIFLDGKFQPAKGAAASLFSQTMHYGYGVFEGIRAYATIHGTKIFKPYEHFERLIMSCQLLNIPFNYSLEELTQLSYQVLEKNNLSSAYIRPLVITGENMALSGSQESTLMIATWKWPKYFSHKEIDICISSIERPNPKSTKVDAKTCGQYVHAILASNEARQRGFDEALMLDANGFVAQGPGANFFFEKNGVLYTAPQGNILPGITRQTVIEICNEMEIPVKEKFFKPEELLEADSAFFCGTATEISAIRSFERHPMHKPWPSSLGSIVQQAYNNMVMEKSFAYVIV